MVESEPDRFGFGMWMDEQPALSVVDWRFSRVVVNRVGCLFLYKRSFDHADHAVVNLVIFPLVLKTKLLGGEPKFGEKP